ncbi:hypothetical protein [Streptomyces sp. AS02]|uniref:hypothetical protein n=1 Tax=Streptomyces sp. AS02 TaxID=2938946 RepID=UPI002020FB39|nr:hypothetical protein [Streptomyces sp. AS02]MCL8014921.1 hypothetical protein [Streptomyces sp. AS02]
MATESATHADSRPSVSLRSCSGGDSGVGVSVTGQSRWNDLPDRWRRWWRIGSAVTLAVTTFTRGHPACPRTVPGPVTEGCRVPLHIDF